LSAAPCADLDEAWGGAGRFAEADKPAIGESFEDAPTEKVRQWKKEKSLRPGGLYVATAGRDSMVLLAVVSSTRMSLAAPDQDGGTR